MQRYRLKQSRRCTGTPRGVVSDLVAARFLLAVDYQAMDRSTVRSNSSLP